MTDVVDISAEYEKQIRQVVRRDLSRRRASAEYVEPMKIKAARRFPEIACILNATLGPATNFKTGGTSAMATVLDWNTDTEEWTESGKEEKVWNHSETANFAADTGGFARHIRGHYVFFGDCSPMADRGGA